MKKTHAQRASVRYDLDSDRIAFQIFTERGDLISSNYNNFDDVLKDFIKWDNNDLIIDPFHIVIGHSVETNPPIGLLINRARIKRNYGYKI